MRPLERAAGAVLADLRGRKFLKYLFADDPENRGAYGYVDKPIDVETQQEIAERLARAVLQAIREPSEGMLMAAFRADDDAMTWDDDGNGSVCNHGAYWTAMIDAALSE